MPPYSFGFPDVLVHIHFPQSNQNQGKPPTQSLPWFWFIGPPARPFYYQYIAPGLPGGHGWQRTANFPMIKILPIDTQTLQPTPPLGFPSLESAIDADPTAADFSWGRFKFTDQFFWQVLGMTKPEFTTKLGVPTQINPGKNTKPIATTISKAVNDWKSRWNFGANGFNAAAGTRGAKSGDGSTYITYPFPKTQFAVPLPTSNNVAGLVAAAGEYYLGPIPGGFWFNGGQAEIYKQAYCFSMLVSQLDINKWDMSEFPPTRLDEFESPVKDYSGYGLVNFPLSGPQIIGGG